MTFAAFGSSVDVSGVLGSGQWDSDTVRVTGDITLPTGSVLSIVPGVRVEFTGAFSFTVNGELRAVGTFNDPITFTAQNPNDNGLRWKGIRLINAARNCQFKFCVIEYGWARGDWPQNCGGGLYLEGSSPLVSRCTIANNRADGEGGGVYGWFTTSTFQNNLIVRNHSDRFGGGIFLAYSSPSLINLTVVDNFAGGWGGGIFAGAQAAPVIKNCILVFNEEDEEIPEGRLDPAGNYSANLGRARSSASTVSYTLINAVGDDPYAGTGNIIAVPGFIDMPNDDFHLRLDSPCIDAGDPLMNPRLEPDVLVNRINIGAYGGTEEAALSKPVIYNRLSDEFDRPLDFGNVRVNSQSSQDITIENHGHYWLTIEDLVFSAPVRFSSDSTEDDDGNLIPRWAVAPIQPGENLKFSILFGPNQLIDYEERVEIRSSDDAHIPIIELKGTGINPVASYRADSTKTSRDLDFGSMQISEVHHSSIYVHNRGETNLTVTSVAFQANSEFDYDFFAGGSEVASLTIVPGDSGLVRFSFTPSRPEPYDEPAAIRTNDLSMPITLKGRGVGPKMIVETDSLFLGYVYFNGDQAVDTIWVFNFGDSALVVDQITFNDTVGAFSADLPQNAIAQLDSGFIKVYFDPPTPNMDFESVMTIGSNYPIDHEIELLGRGMAEPGRYMFGHVSGVWSWSANSPSYIILDSVYVPAQSRLKIEAGARVLFEPGASFQADGEVRCAGTETDSVWFIPRDQSGTDGARWKGMRLNRSDKSRLSYCVINNSVNGLRIREASPLVEFCTITDNGAGDPDDIAFTNDGGGVYMENSGVHLSSCLIDGNVARYGGGVFVLNSIPTITNCVIGHNMARVGGGIYLRFQSSAHIQSNLIYTNSATVSGAGIAVLEHSSPYIVNNTISLNNGDGLYSGIRSIPALVNNVIWDNDSSIVLGANGNVLVSYCDVEGGAIGTEILDVDPMFMNGNGFDFLLQDGSPLIDKGNPEDNHRDWSLPPAKGTIRNDIGAYGGSLSGNWKKPVVDLTMVQNPAFPQWVDIYVTAFDALTNPTCTAELNGREVDVTLTELDPMNFHGSYEFDAEGSIFILTEAEVNGQAVTVGRTFELTLIYSSRDNSTRLADSRISIPVGAVDRDASLMAQINPTPIKPTDHLLFLTQIHSFSSDNTELRKEATVIFDVAAEGWTAEDQDKLGIYRKSGSGWQRLEGGFHDGKVSGKTLKLGEFAVAWDESFDPDDSRPVPESAELIRAYPNPFNQSVSVEYNLAADGQVNLTVYDLSGRLVSELQVGFQSAGSHVSVWDGRSSSGSIMPSGVYFMRLETAGAERSIKLMLVR